MTNENKKTICMIGVFPPPINGQAVAFETLAESPEFKQKYNVIKADYAPKKSFKKRVMVLYKFLRNIGMLLFLKKIVNSQPIDIYYLGISSSNQGAVRDSLITKVIGKKLDCAKFVIHHHGGNFRTFYEATDEKHRTMVNTYLKKTDIAIVLTPKLKELFKDLLPEGNIRVVSNGINAENKLPDKVVKNKIEGIKAKKKMRILYLSNMKKTKGYMKLLQSAPLLVQEGIAIEMVFAGAFESEEDKKEFNGYIEKHNLASSVRYLGVVTGGEKNKLLETSDVFVLPTTYPQEGQPISILEAMAAGMAIISTDHGGITDVVNHEKNGLILSSIEPEYIAAAIKRLCIDRDFMARICKLNVLIANDHYMESHYVDNMIRIFDELTA